MKKSGYDKTLARPKNGKPQFFGYLSVLNTQDCQNYSIYTTSKKNRNLASLRILCTVSFPKNTHLPVSLQNYQRSASLHGTYCCLPRRSCLFLPVEISVVKSACAPSPMRQTERYVIPRVPFQDHISTVCRDRDAQGFPSGIRPLPGLQGWPASHDGQ